MHIKNMAVTNKIGDCMDRHYLVVNGHIGCSRRINFIGDSTGVNITGFDPDGFRFSLAATEESAALSPLTLFLQSVRIKDTLDCINFKMRQNSSLGQILVSDQSGVGRWANPAEVFNDEDWHMTEEKDLLANSDARNVGIGTETPVGRFQINDRMDKIAFGSFLNEESFTNFGYLGYNVARKLVEGEEPKWILDYRDEDGSNGGSFIWGSLDGSLSFATIASTYSYENQLFTDPEIAGQVKMTIDNTGHVGIGISPHPSYSLAVAGKIICEELKVKLVSDWTWPDFVFEKNHKLQSLYELENQIIKNKRLPGIPGSAEVRENGIDLGDMNARLLEKVEELTLYIIDLQKQVDQLKSERTESK